SKNKESSYYRAFFSINVNYLELLQDIIDNGIYSVANCELNFLASFCIENTEEQKREILELKEKTLNVLSNKKLNMKFNQELLIFKKLNSSRKK
ncbi:MAG: hypothetical protein K2K18_02320, partial [Malacoplasma sp.]|nr:hypothetical protein [Malacoplasma sp.]